MPNQSLKVGDMIIDFDQIHVVFKIENDVVFYRPLTKDQNKGEITSSIPLSNLKKAGIRPLFSKEDVEIFLEELSQSKPLDLVVTNNINNNNALKECLYLNDPVKTGQLLVLLAKRQQESVLTKSDQIIFDQALNHLSSEISIASGVTLEAAKKEILTAINNTWWGLSTKTRKKSDEK